MKRVLIIPDTHAPNHDKKAVDAVLAYASTQAYDELVILGDLGDFDSVNSHNKSKPGLQEGKRLKDDIEATRSVLVDFVFAARRINVDCNAHYLLGNHEARAETAALANPAWLGLSDLGSALETDELGIKLYPYRKRKAAMKLGKLHFLHGSYFGENAVKKHLDRLSCSFVMGHIHRVLTVTKPSQHGTMLGACVGHLADPDIGESYLDGPDGWQQGFAEAFIHDNGNFNLYPIVIVKGAFVGPDGRRYSSGGWDRLLAPIGLSESTSQALYRGLSQKLDGPARAPQSGRTDLGNLHARKTSAEAKKPSNPAVARRTHRSRSP